MSRPDTIAELERLRGQQVAIWDSENGKERAAAHAKDRAQLAIIELDAEIDRRRAVEKGMGNA